MGKGPSSRSGTGSRVARGNAPRHCKMMVRCSNILQSPLLQAVAFGNTAAGLNNALEQINQGIAAALCGSLGWIGDSGILRDLRAPELGGGGSSHQPGFAPWVHGAQRERFGRKEELWTQTVLSKAPVSLSLSLQWTRHPAGSRPGSLAVPSELISFDLLA